MTAASGDGHPPDGQFLELYAELRAIADRLLRREAPGHTLQPTALVHEAWFKRAGAAVTTDRAHFLGLAARAMRQVLVDCARRRQAAKRGGAIAAVTITDVGADVAVPLDEMLALDDALTRLAANDARAVRVVELRFFAGLDEREIAGLLGITTRTVQRDWARARAWLHLELAGDA